MASPLDPTPLRSPADAGATPSDYVHAGQPIPAIERIRIFEPRAWEEFVLEWADIVISGRQRAGHGKGVRAITHSAFNIALADYCANRDMPHPLTVTIDSPLVVYREPDDDEGGFSTEVKDMFYRSLAARCALSRNLGR